MNKKPASWNNSNEKKIPDKWKTKNSNQPPKAWYQKADTPDTWSKPRQKPDGWTISRDTPTARKSHDRVSDIAGKAKIGAGMLNEAAKKLGDKAKNAAEKTAALAKSDETAEKISLAKGKANAAFSGLKSKTNGLIQNAKDKFEADENADEILSEDTVPDESESISETEYEKPVLEETSEDTVSEEDMSSEEHDKAIDDMISAALSASDETQPDEEADENVSYTEDEVPEPDNSYTDESEYPNTGQNEKHNNSIQHESTSYYPEELYSHEDLTDSPEKKANLKKTLIGIAIVLACGFIALNSFAYFYGGEKNNQQSRTSAPVQNTETAKAEEASQPTETEAVSETVKEEASAEPQTEPPVSRTDTSAAVKTALQKHMQEQTNTSFFDPAPTYSLYDVNADGTDELFISYKNYEGSICSDTYIYKNGTYQKCNRYNIYTAVCLEEKLVYTHAVGGGEATYIYSIENGELLQKDEFTFSPGDSYSHNNQSISKSEYNTLLDEYNNMNFVNVSINSRPVSELIDTSVYKNYSTFDTSAATSDFYFYPTVKQALVNVDSGGLNLRATPDFNGELIVMMNNKASVVDYGSNNAWAYVCYSDGTKTYYGYANKQYLKYKETVTVVPCTYYGHIRLTSGTLQGYKRSYVVEGGTPETYNVSLQNGWHIKAVNYCYSRGIGWYELYDADDGDYYGWVDANFIQFD